jgi:proline iminopeptidase
MKHLFIITSLLLIQTFAFGQKDSIYYKKISESETSIIPLKEGYKLFAQKFGTGKIKILLLHGGPVNTHEGFEIFLTQLPLDKYTIIFYDQLGSYYSDQTSDTTLCTISRYVEEVEQVRQFYNLDCFYLLGHSWGGLLAIEYAIKYPQKLNGLILSNKSYSQENLVNTRKELMIEIAKDLKSSDKTLKQLSDNEKITDSVEASKISYQFEISHLIRLQPEPDAFVRMKKHSGPIPGNLRQSNFHDRDSWNALDNLHLIKQPTLLIGSKYDFVKIEDLKEMQKRIPHCTLYVCPNGSHMDFWDDTNNYFTALQKFISDTEKK